MLALSVDADERAGWRSNWLRSIQEFADEEAQRRSWLNPFNANPHYSFAELMCSYFNDLQLGDEGYAQFHAEDLVCAQEVTAVAHFHELARSYASPTDDNDHAAILADAGWRAVVGAASEAQSALCALLTDEQERKAVQDRSDHAGAAMRQR